MRRRSLLKLTAAMMVLIAHAQAQAVEWYDETVMADHGHNGIYYTLATQPQAIAGGYRYVIEVFGVQNGGGQNHALAGFDRDDLMNLYDTVGDWRLPNDPLCHWEYSLKDFWTTGSVEVNPADWSAPPSQYNGFTVAWEATPHPWGADGHPVPNRVTDSYTGMWEYYYPIGIAQTGDSYDSATGVKGPVGEDFMCILNWDWGWGNNGGLMMTMVLESRVAYGAGDLRWSLPDYGSGIDWDDTVWIDHPDYVAGIGVDFDDDGVNDVTHESYGIYNVLDGGFTWPAEAGVPGDFDGDGDVDTDDIDILCDNLGDPAFDLDNDGDADADDFALLIHPLVELTDGSGRTGTEIGDFNLDGVINGTDLATMAANFGATPPPDLLYEDGNANCDNLINATDLAVLAANFGYTAPPAAVPEPVTMSLLGIGACLPLLRKRK